MSFQDRVRSVANLIAGTVARKAIVCVLGVAVSASIASAAPEVIYAVSDPNLPNYFTVNFPPELGGPQTADIMGTRFMIRLDAEAGTAGFVSWFQRVAPLSLAGISTGPITVRLADVSTGFFDAPGKGSENEGAFSTTEAYNVHFAGDLSMFGLQSPFFIPSSSTGTITYDKEGARTGIVSMEWTGVGSIPNPFDPANPFTFTYACAVNSRFVTAVACEEVDVLNVECRRPYLRAVVHLADESQDGGVVAIDVNGEPFGLPVQSNTASMTIRKRIGSQTVTVEGGADGCGPSAEVDCE